MKKSCEYCGKIYPAKTDRSRFCKPSCRIMAHQKSKKKEVESKVKVGWIDRLIGHNQLKKRVEKLEVEMTKIRQEITRIKND